MTPVRRPRRDADVQHYEIGDELLLYSARSSSVITLNPIARAVWELCDGRRSLMEITSELEERFDWPPARLFVDVETAVRRFVDEHVADLLEESPAPRPTAAPASAQHVGVNGSRVSVYSSSARVREGIRRRLGMMLDHASEDTLAHFEIRPVGANHVLLKDGHPVRIDRSLDLSLRHFEGEVVQTLMAARHDLLWLHAAAAATQGRALVLCGCQVSARAHS